MSNIELYSGAGLNKVPAEVQDREVIDYTFPMDREGVQSYIGNVISQLYVLGAGNHLFPVTVNDEEYANSYVCSPYTTYVSYARQELQVLNNRMLETALKGLISLIEPLLKSAQINKVVCLNNWLLSTNLYPQWEGSEIPEITSHLADVFPGHTLMWRSLNPYTNQSLIGHLIKAGYLLVPSRQIFIFDNHLNKFQRKRNIVNDFKLLRTTAYRAVRHEEIQPEDYPRIAELYFQLYFRKYSNCSPLFTDKFVRLCHEKRILNLQGVRNSEGRLAGVVGSFFKGNVMTTPLVGYDTGRPLEEGLFRLVTALAIKEGLEKPCVFNISAGVSDFKRRRGAVPFIEYSAIYQRHLPRSRRAAWKSLEQIMAKIGVPLLQKFRF